MVALPEQYRYFSRQLGAADKPLRLEVVKAASKNDIYADTIRIHKDDRVDKWGCLIPYNKVVKARINGVSHFCIVHRHHARGKVAMDLTMRDRFQVKTSEQYDVSLEVPILGSLRWALGSSSIVARTSMWLGLWSCVLAVLSLVVALAD